MKKIGVKEYATLINKSDKYVYKLVKTAQVQSQLNGKKIEILVDELLYKNLNSSKNRLEERDTRLEELELRVKKLEEALKPKIFIKRTKTLKKVPLKKSLKKPSKKGTLK